MRAWWWNRSSGARWGIVGVTMVAALVAWGIADTVILDRFNDQRQAHAITEAEFGAVQDDATQEQVLASFGEPEGAEVLDEGADGCFTYKQEGAPLLRERTYRFCFEGGTLILKDFAPIEEADKLGEGDVLEGG